MELNNDIILVNVDPSKSSCITQEMCRGLLEIINLDIPPRDMSQVLDKESWEYIMFDRYLYNWMNKHYRRDTEYIFIMSSIEKRWKDKITNVLKSKNYGNYSIN